LTPLYSTAMGTPVQMEFRRWLVHDKAHFVRRFQQPHRAVHFHRGTDDRIRQFI
jgi:hypothetical protein